MRRILFVCLAVMTLAQSGHVVADLIGHGGMVRSVDISPDGRTVLTGSFDYTARLWDFGDQSSIAVFDLHDGPVTSVGFAPDGQRAFTTSDDFSAIVWDINARQPLVRLNGHRHKVMAAAFAPSGDFLVTGAWDKKWRMFDLPGGNLRLEAETNSPVNAVLFSKDGTKVISGGHHPTIQIWNAETGDLSGTLDGHRGAITALSLSPDGTRLLSASIDKSVRLWDLATETQISAIDVRDQQVYDVSFSFDGLRALTAGKDGFIVEWNLTTGEAETEIAAHDRIAWSAAFTPDGRFAVSTSSDEAARVWHLSTGDRIGDDGSEITTPQPWLESSHPGAAMYLKCAKCHALSADEPQRSGPHFAELFGRPVGSVSGYRYSAALKEATFEWNEQTIFQLFDEGPDVMLPGTKMPVQRVTDPQQLKDLVAYIKLLTTTPTQP